MTQVRSAKALFRVKLDCVVPRLRGKSFRNAERRLRNAHCRTGKVRHRDSRAKKGRVISQSPRPAKRLRDRTKINLVLSSGRRG
jgi:beta-lactam-binding protein with PASTA domain